MTEKITLRVFLISLVSCASLVLSFVWGDGPASEVHAKVAATFFIIGLGSFLGWFTLMLYRLRDALRGKTDPTVTQ